MKAIPSSMYQSEKRAVVTKTVLTPFVMAIQGPYVVEIMEVNKWLCHYQIKIYCVIVVCTFLGVVYLLLAFPGILSTLQMSKTNEKRKTDFIV